MATKQYANNSSSRRTGRNFPSNYVILTLHAIADGEARYANSGSMMAKVRAFLSQGKDKDSHEYKPSIFVDVMAFSQNENTTPVLEAISQLRDKDLFTVKGRLAMDVWTGQDGAARQQLLVVAVSVEPFSFENGEQGLEEELGAPS